MAFIDKEELGFVIDSQKIRCKSNTKTFLYVSNNRIVGLCIAEEITKVM